MFKKILTFIAAMYVAIAFAAVDVNKGTAAELDSIKGIGPAMSGKIIEERKKGNFKDWPDFIERVKGVGDNSAAKLSAEGLTVGGATFKGVAAAPSAPAAKATDKPAAAAPAVAPATPAAKAEAKPATPAAMPATPAPAAKAEAKPAAGAMTAPAAAMAKEEKKDPKAEAKAKKDAEKADKAAKKEEAAKDKSKATAKADEAKPAASAAKK